MRVRHYTVLAKQLAKFVHKLLGGADAFAGHRLKFHSPGNCTKL